MRQVVMHGPGDVRVEDREDPRIIEPTDAIIRLSATCICGSDLWPYRGAEPVDHQVMGHEYVGVVEEVGSEVHTVQVGDFVVGSFWASDNTCEICQAGYQAYCVHRVLMGTIGTQSGWPASPSPTAPLSQPPACPTPTSFPPSWRLPTCSAPGGSPPRPPKPGPARRSRSSVTARSACSASLPPSSSARENGSSRSAGTRTAKHWPGSSVPPTSSKSAARRASPGSRSCTGGLGAHSVIEAVGTQEAMMQAIHSTRPGGHVGFVGVSHDVAIPGDGSSWQACTSTADPRRSASTCRGWRSPPHLERKIDPGKVFDLTLPLEKAAEGTGPWTSAPPPRSC